MKILLALFALTLTVGAQEINSGHIFQDGDHVTASLLNSMVTAATISSTFYTDKSSATIASGDVFVYYSLTATGFRKTTYGAAFLNNVALITAQAEKTSPVAADMVLAYDSVGLSLVKIQIGNILTLGNTLNPNHSNTVPVVEDPLLILFPVYLGGNFNGATGLTGGTNYNASLSNLFARFPYTQTFTNLPVHTAVNTNTDRLLYWNSRGTNAAGIGGTNEQISITSLLTNWPSITNGISNNATFLTINGDGTITSVTLTQIQASVNVSAASFSMKTNIAINGFWTNPTVRRLFVSQIVSNYSTTGPAIWVVTNGVLNARVGQAGVDQTSAASLVGMVSTVTWIANVGDWFYMTNITGNGASVTNITGSLQGL